MEDCFPIDILRSHLFPAESVKNLGLLFDSDSDVVQTYSDYPQPLQLCNWRHVGWFLIHGACVLVANAFDSSWLDYCNIQNSAAGIVSNTSHTCLQISLQLFSTSVLLYFSLSTAVLILPGTVRVVVISLSFQSSIPVSINLSSSLGRVLL